MHTTLTWLWSGAVGQPASRSALCDKRRPYVHSIVHRNSADYCVVGLKDGEDSVWLAMRPGMLPRFNTETVSPYSVV